MFSLENGKQYALSSNQSNADMLQSDSKTYVFLKLTDSAFRAIGEYQKNAAAHRKSKPKIQFTGDMGVMKIPLSDGDSRPFKFSLSQIDPNNTSSCIEHEEIRTGSRHIEMLGGMGHKITICADDDIWQQTKVKMTLAEEENKKVCTKEIKPSAGSKFRAKFNKKISRNEAGPVKKPEIKSNVMSRILAQQHAEVQGLKAPDARPSRVAHRPRKPEPSSSKTTSELSPKSDDKPIDSKPIVDSKPVSKPIVDSKPVHKSPKKPRPSQPREESLKRPGPPVEASAAKKARCDPDPPPNQEPSTNLLDNAASHWKKQPQTQNRNFFSDRRSPDCRPKLAVPPMPASKPTESVPNDEKVEQSDRNKENEVETPDQYLREYTEICSVPQRVQYKQDFNAEYEEYQKLHSSISSVSKRFQRMENDLKSAEEGTKMHEEIKKTIVQQYVVYKKDPGYVKDKSRFDYLHKKLSHIKKLIVDYDNKQIPS